MSPLGQCYVLSARNMTVVISLISFACVYRSKIKCIFSINSIFPLLSLRWLFLVCLFSLSLSHRRFSSRLILIKSSESQLTPCRLKSLCVDLSGYSGPNTDWADIEHWCYKLALGQLSPFIELKDFHKFQWTWIVANWPKMDNHQNALFLARDIQFEINCWQKICNFFGERQDPLSEKSGGIEKWN